ncbi:hypothetical protein [Pseudomonas californiensis]|uniref:hypothetical protein n=1 Tax=Pseudomonas californiensis TaxID=2829823 RepID=UPI001E6287CB|nr:hypothetical protein [Pseudomonas californiensis]
MGDAQLNIACLGWGSLIWVPGALPLAGEWYSDGPSLPIEFARVGDSGELATAICLNAPPVKVFWALVAADTLAQACEALREREQISVQREDGIGTLLTARLSEGLMMRWAKERGIDAIIWTALPPRINGIEGRIPSLDDALEYLGSLSGDTLDHARTYFEKVPEQIDTPYRRAIKRQLGWDGQVSV